MPKTVSSPARVSVDFLQEPHFPFPEHDVLSMRGREDGEQGGPAGVREGTELPQGHHRPSAGTGFLTGQ